MKKLLKNQDLKSVNFTALSRDAMKNVLGAAADLTKQQYCEADHVGRCGVCDKQGVFTPCA
ncbi:hypothetical protein [Mucilaginibacter phyllosphaerae]|uniref:Uncharacterized protein n=1 Tax=Mucilaginibacter phyllosphaerae TaxID=1812349 RepID=A0A4Y8AAY8_9SPHI|nr:hypothetical protein [Mucilaginibacter phyllosphaerae]MBB3969614.1 hypothetical protein [Mucilaginibacter phyllosphaerae]TEW65001.1 hypothetical protein E2R65_13855 [Mucilaginibacter phyllosphaerae]GGH18598.1 hypothetical protein GCM10007352_29430 [Mucilaginibacter phyllosphaerae]